MSINNEISDREIYWNQYYSGKSVPDIPSQFAVFVLNENQEVPVIIEIGCGNGRDALFFMQHGVCIIGVDGSVSAIETCEKKAGSISMAKSDFILGNVADTLLDRNIQQSVMKIKNEGPVLIYSRFFIHAITDEEEAAFIALSSRLIDAYGGKVALEFRTKRDMLQPKVTGAHFRRYVDPVHFFSRMEKNGFEVEYFAEGFGFAKYKTDDAHVARFILRKSTNPEK